MLVLTENRRQKSENREEKKVAGEHHATKQLTHRPKLTRTSGLRVRAKVLTIILQTRKKTRMEV